LDGEESDVKIYAAYNYSPVVHLTQGQIGFDRAAEMVALTNNISSSIQDKVRQDVNSSTLGRILEPRYSLTVNVNETIRTTVASYLNFSETTDDLIRESGQIKRQVRTYADFNYDALGGKSFIDEIADNWETYKVGEVYDQFKEITGYKDPIDLLKEQIEQSAKKTLERQFDKMGAKELFEKLTSLAEKNGKYFNVALDIAQNLQGDLSDEEDQNKTDYIKEITKATITELLKYFITNGENLPKGINQHPDTKKQAVDDTKVVTPDEHDYE
jgi:hypothetical protein